MSDLAIGIDLGTTYSCVSFIRNEKIEIIEDEIQNSTFPSIVSFNNKKIYVGDSAKSERIKNFQNTICNIKRIIGIPYDEIDKEEKEKYNEQLEKNPKNNFSLININDNNEITKYSPEQIYSFIFKYIIKLIEKRIHKEIKKNLDIVLTVPANFNYFQINATVNAAKNSGLNVIRIIKEPTAAAITYLYLNPIYETKKILIFDFGGGTLDISIANTNKNHIEIIYTEGENYLGGEDFDNRLVKYCAKCFLEEHKLDINNNKKALTRLQIECENAKKSLSYMEETMIDIDNLMNGIDFNLIIDRATFEILCADLFDKAINILKNALRKAKLNKEDINDIILVGGTSKIPKIRNEINKLFNTKTKVMLEQNNNIEEFVAKGATIQHAIIKKINNFKINFFVTDIYPKSIGIRINENKIYKLIPQHSPIPIESCFRFKTSEDFIEKMNFTICEGDKYDNYKKIIQLTKKIPSKPCGEVIVYLTIKIDINSNLIIEIKDNLSNDKINEIIEIQNVFQSEINHKLSDNNSKIKKIIQETNSLEKKLENINDENDKIEKLKKLITLYIEYLEQIDIKISDNQIYEKDYILYLQKLINKYHELFQINNSMVNLNDDFKKIEILLEKVKTSQINELIPDLRKLEIFKEDYFNFIIYMISKLKICCIKYYLDNKNLANYFLNIIYKVSDELLEKKISQYKSLCNKYDDIIKDCKFYESRIKAKKIIEEGDKKYKELKQKLEMNKESYQTLCQIFKKALDIVYNNTNKKDFDYIIIIITRLMIIQYEYNDIRNEDIFKNFSNILEMEKIELFERKENKEWFNELIKIIEEIIDLEYENNIKTKTYLNFIKFILPIKPNITYENFEKNYNTDPIKSIIDLRSDYFPEKEENAKNEIKKNFYHKITSKLNDLRNKLTSKDDENFFNSITSL